MFSCNVLVKEAEYSDDVILKNREEFSRISFENKYNLNGLIYP